MFHHLVDSPVGRLLLTGDGDALTGLHLVAARDVDPPAASVADAAPFRAVTAQLEAYFAGGLTAFDVPLRLAGTPFQQQVWAALLDIPCGRTRSYGEVAAAIGRPGAARAVGAANGRNPVGIIVPCHRVIGADGSLTGYGWGTERKRWLLEHERRTARSAA